MKDSTALSRLVALNVRDTQRQITCIISSEKNGRVMLKGTCAVCEKTKTQFVKSGGLFNKAVSNLPYEVHLPGHNFTGPGTKLDRSLNPDGTPRDWSKPINRVDEAAYHYAKNPYTQTRNEV